MGYELRPRDIFLYPQISRLAVLLGEKEALDLSPILSSDLEGSCGLLPIQRWYFSVDTSIGVLSHFNQSMLLCIDKGLELSWLRDVWELIWHHHDALRFRYTQRGGDWHQYYAKGHFELEVRDLSTEVSGALSDIIESVCTDYHQRLSLEGGEIFRAVLMLTPETEDYNRLLLVAHHLGVDGVSWRILLEDLSELLNQLSEGLALSLGRKSSSYRSWYESLISYSRVPAWGHSCPIGQR